MSDFVGERGLGRHLGDRNVWVNKRGTQYRGDLHVDEKGKYFIFVDSIFRKSNCDFDGKECGNGTARVYINRPGKDVVWFLGKNYRVGNNKRASRFRDFEFASYDPAKYKAVQKGLAKNVQVITDRGLTKNLYNFCAVRKLSPQGNYSRMISGLIFPDGDDFQIMWTGEENGEKIEEWDRVILSKKATSGDFHTVHYLYRKK